jgi:sigma-B regulation protein RsbU (phosphoserine phosphatase)
VSTGDFVRAAEEAAQAYDATRRIIILSLVFTAVLSVLGAAAVASIVSRPLGALAEAARRVAQGDLDIRLERSSQDEVGRLTSSFNQMTSALRRARRESDEHTAAISRAHDELQERLEQIEDLSTRNLEQERALREKAERELETARRLQMGLMPREDPQLAGFDISGRCRPAQEVGGDFFQFFSRPNQRLTLSLADVTGHAMEAAIPVVQFSGILESEMDRDQPLDVLFERLNRTLLHALERRTFVCFLMGEIDPVSRNLRVANGGCPYPFHYRAASGAVEEITVHAYPLGAVAAVRYPVVEVDLQPGDRIVFCSDGVIEAVGGDGDDPFGFERTAEAVAACCADGASAATVIDRLLATVDGHARGTDQQDDQTIVVAAVNA